jgi:hypothetical protein
MCFSPEVDLIGGAAIAAIGIDTLRHVDHDNERAVAYLPLIFGLHQVVEAFVWWGLDGRVATAVGDVAAWVYLAIAFGLLPWFVPLAVRRLEPDLRKRTYDTVLIGVGALVGVYLMAAVISGPIQVIDGGYYLSYSVALTFGGTATALYVASTCGSLLISSDRYLARYGVVNLLAVVALSVLLVAGVISLWCVWAAITSVAIAIHLRRTDQHRHRFPSAPLTV